MKKPHSKAFTLLELAFVILIIGIFVAGIMSAKDLVKKSKLANARALTESSPVAGTSGLKIWVETTLDNAISPNTNLEDGAAITQWNDINPQSKVKYSLSGGSSPFYKEFGINDLPSLNFVPNSYLTIPNCRMFNNINYTVFIVDMLTEPQNPNSDFTMALLGGNNIDANSNNSSNITLSYNYTIANKYYQTLFNYSTPGTYNYTFTTFVPHIHTLKYDSGTSYYWLDSGITADSQKPNGQIDNCYQSWLGKDYGKNYYRGYVSELILFNRSLTDDERQTIETYLSKKYNIMLSF